MDHVLLGVGLGNSDAAFAEFAAPGVADDEAGLFPSDSDEVDAPGVTVLPPEEPLDEADFLA